MKKLLTVIMIFFFASLTMAQTLGGSFMLGYPQGDFRKNVDQMGFGFQMMTMITTTQPSVSMWI